MLAPEMTMFSSLSGTNVMHAIFASLSIIYVYRWYAKGDKGAFPLAILLLAINVWCRAEGIAFIAASAVLAIIHAVRNKSYACLGWGLLSIVPAAAWALFTSAIGMTTEGTVISHLFWDGEKASKIFTYATALLTNTQYYGWAWPAFAIAVLANIVFLAKHKDAWSFPCLCLLSVFIYFLIVYQINYTWDSIDNVLNYPSKRFLFCFIPLAWYYFFSNRTVNTGMKKLTDFLAK